jgi:hypothetical protein
MSLTNYNEELLNTVHLASDLGNFDWTTLEAQKNEPTFENFQVTAGNLSAQIGVDEEDKVVAAGSPGQE